MTAKVGDRQIIFWGFYFEQVINEVVITRSRAHTLSSVQSRWPVLKPVDIIICQVAF